MSIFSPADGPVGVSGMIFDSSIRPQEIVRQPMDLRMLSSPLVRRLLLLFGGFGSFCLILLGLVCLSVSSTETEVLVLRGRIIVAASTLLVLGLLIFVPLVQRWIIPIGELTRAMQRLAMGEQPEQVGIESEDELGQLTIAFNDMVQKVESRSEELRASRSQVARDNEQLATVLQAMVEGVIAVDQEEKILLANMAAVRLLDLKAFNVVGRRTWETVRLPQIHELIRVTLADDSPMDEKQRRMEFQVPWTHSTLAVVASRLPGDPCPGAVLVLHDVTELRRLERLRREFVSNVSHELKTPLAAITAYAETLLGGALEDGDIGRTFVGRIAEQSERLNTLILDLLELARIESGEHAFHVDAVEINSILQTSVDAHQAIARSRQMTLTCTSTEAELMAQADLEGLRTVIDNLIGNAINYTRAGGAITVRSRRDDDWIAFEVEDTGVGIAKEFQSRIFERFFRVDRARSREVGGTGLGLSIVKHLCHVFGGTIKVSSQIGQGSIFTVLLKQAD
jgi:two-component system phosphate regulon sensor histidine kinase PhoR